MKKFYLMIPFFFFSSCTSEHHQSFVKSYNIIHSRELTCHELQYIIQTLVLKNYLLIDLRNPKLFKEDHIKNAISVPYKNLAKFLSKSITYESTLIFYDQKKTKQGKIKKMMQKYQTIDYVFLKDGFLEWQKFTKNQT